MKDNNNIYNYGLWSGAEYDNDLTTILFPGENISIISSNEYSTIGEYSLKLTKTSTIEEPNSLRIYNLEINENDNIYFTCEMLPLNITSGYVTLIRNNNGIYNSISYCSISPNIKQKISLSGEINGELTSLVVRIWLTGAGVIYLDNLTLIKN